MDGKNVLPRKLRLSSCCLLSGMIVAMMPTVPEGTGARRRSGQRHRTGFSSSSRGFTACPVRDSRISQWHPPLQPETEIAISP